MSEGTRQKVLLGVLGALVLGAGTYFFFLRDSGPSAGAASRGRSVARERAEVAEQTQSESKVREAKTSERKVSESRERKPAERERSVRKERRGGTKKKDSKEVVPAA